jgi:purine-nucleoside phosphorylase
MSAATNLARIAALTDIEPATAIILGSGLGGFAETVEDAVTIPYGDLEGFPRPGVSGHAGALILGRIAHCPVAILSGRAHYYESGRADAMRPALATLAALGADTLIVTNSAGSLRQDMPPGSVMMIEDHIAFSGPNPLIGEPDEARFVGMTQAYDPGLRDRARAAAEAEGIACPGGVYIWFSGPSFETPAEIRAARALGADAVGMSTVPEVVLARFLGLRVLGFSVITNYAAGMTGAELSHDETKAVAPEGGARLARILTRFLGDQGA